MICFPKCSCNTLYERQHCWNREGPTQNEELQNFTWILQMLVYHFHVFYFQVWIKFTVLSIFVVQKSTYELLTLWTWVSFVVSGISGYLNICCYFWMWNLFDNFYLEWNVEKHVINWMWLTYPLKMLLITLLHFFFSCYPAIMCVGFGQKHFLQLETLIDYQWQH